VSRKHARRFLNWTAASSRPYLGKPLRELPEIADPPELVELIASATNIRDEPEADSEAVAHYAEVANRYHTIRHAREVEQREQARQLLTLEHRMTAARGAAKMQRVDVSGELYVLDKMLKRARKGGVSDPPPVIERLERLEARLDHKPQPGDLAA